jgi:hypothetical protein
MPNRESLLAGRNTQPLSDDDVRRVYNTFLGLDNTLPVRYEAGARTVFRVPGMGAEPSDCEVTFGEDIYPGKSVLDPNASISMQAAVAHEISHFCRWRDKTEIDDPELFEIDEALTSLEAILRFPKQLNDHDSRQLIADAIQRLQIYVQKLGK